MRVRNFDGTDDWITCEPGSADITGAWSMALLVRPRTIAYRVLYQGHTSSGGSAGYGFEQRVNGEILLYSTGFGERLSPVGYLVAGRWRLVATTKASGAVAPHFYSYDFATGTWLDAASTSTIGNPTALGVGGSVIFGRWEHNWRYDGQIAAAAVWDEALSFASVRALAAAPALVDWASVSSPNALWLFDRGPESPLQDLVGGADERAGASQGTNAVLVDDVPIPYRRATAAVYAGGSWSDRELNVHNGAGWVPPAEAEMR
ncbi:hypothetical protein VSS74_25100 [Conexibacter stalactiti]|uniref:LamG-like jellyroll fold domain-containing protein n=1 Tax=Conexibacter stalactiti TaxID=1940611 RepID=A0ABU4HWH4_9ACTN|nr:hypothetical protein [Conexibacter stalactiti]MDW5597653.1 hypothetical protein [Conexibacter stalactiti]MEC5038295.1 hypothetical protein [Conexibacter stalactiti]